MRLLASIQSMWGSLEWIMPVCKYLKDNCHDIEIIFVFFRKDKRDIFGSNRGLEELTREISSGKYYDLFAVSPPWLRCVSGIFNRCGRLFPLTLLKKLEDFWFKVNWKLLGKAFMAKWLDKINPDISLMDGHRNVLFTRLKIKGIKRGFFLTSPSFVFSPEVWIDSEKRKMLYSNMGFDFFLVDTYETFAFFRDFYEEQKICEVGTPKFDTWWIKYIEERAKCQSDGFGEKDFKKSVLILLKNESSAVFKDIDFETVLREIIDVCCRDKETRIIIKPHPRQNIYHLKEILSRYPRAKIVISYESSFVLISKVSYVISMPSGIIFDALIMGKPVIEYFHYGNFNRILKGKFGRIPKNALGGMSYIDSNGCLTSIFRGKELVLRADTPEELAAVFLRLDNDKALWRVKNMRDRFPEGASRKSVEFLLTMIGKESLS